mmetsp:Transcript_14645/g.20891  ORF Transcript_14645/g.20891 Transcript_14645/m.20891 type:complete len:1853 (+) Transcript_14645:178-5736(+)|eukprot:CAMPEP_0184860164 /NCGR_PEP_ID=MMETSP0580-20130426/5112_1 /TAXON_ID=1118495 /ORGANISM="Dactyliosolen fragilissimus" /LENGTH=1852 /DNA_ID=CAMNT_0027357179 /DNA_START=71 /DNA_END=5629 /DNA_ORIENTATION=+
MKQFPGHSGGSDEDHHEGIRGVEKTTHRSRSRTRHTTRNKSPPFYLLLVNFLLLAVVIPLFNNNNVHQVQAQWLQPNGLPFGEMAAGDFPPLACNKDLATAECTSFTASNPDLNLIVSIPCGVCYTFDFPELGEYEFLGGIDVVGKLVFPPNYKATIRLPVLTVQGELEMSSNEIVTTDNIDGLKFLFTGGNDEYFYPHTQNMPSCNNKYCTLGKKTFAVAGGTVNINGLSDTCPTWVNLKDVLTSSSSILATNYPLEPVSPTGCSQVVINENFEVNEGVYKSSLGAMEKIETETSIVDGNSVSNQYFSVYGRKRSWQGPFVNFKKFLKNCMIPDQVYLFKARYRLRDEDPTDGANVSKCQSDGTDCITLTLHNMNLDDQGEEKMNWSIMYEAPSISYKGDDVWQNFYAPIKFSSNDFDASSIYQMLYFGGPEEGIIIDIDDVVMELPRANMFPDPNVGGDVCGTLLTNGDAEIDEMFVYPASMVGNLGSYLSVEEEAYVTNGVATTNRFFAISGRETGWTSIVQPLINDCIVQNSLYRFQAKIRLHSSEPRTVRFTLKTYKEDLTEEPNFTVESLGDCPSASMDTGWVQCDRNFLFKEKHEKAPKIELVFIVEVDNFSNIDYDDISITLVSPPVSSLIVSSEVTSCWGVGADLLQTSHTLNWEDKNIVNITDITTNEDGDAVVSIYPPIAKPTTQKDDERFGVEIALLSRNILIEGVMDDPVFPEHGANFVVIHTPGVAQTLKGVHFRKVGQQGIFGRYPIHLHMSGAIEGTTISRNTISESFQRCIVIHGTHNVTLDYNVAYDTFGHCYMLEDGIEQNNRFNYNLGASTKIMPDESLLSIAESDNFAATFWISNPNNYFLGNVAAGGEDNGFWYEFLDFIRGPSAKDDPNYEIDPSSFIFGFHRDNVVHSNTGEGFKLYPNGYFPKERAFFENVRAYKNKGDGCLLHNSKNLGIEGGTFADNRKSIDVDKQSDDVVVYNANVIGYSPLYKKDVESANYMAHCPAYRPLMGIELHSFLRYRDSKGYELVNITFSHFNDDTGCIGSTALFMDKQVRDGHFDAYSVMDNLTFPDDTLMKEKFTMCELEANPDFLHDLVLQDRGGSLNPDLNGQPGVIISNNPRMTTYGGDNCKDMGEGTCALYCQQSEGKPLCHRGINYAVWNTPDYDELILESTDTNTGETVEFEGYFETETKKANGGIDVPDNYLNYIYQRRRYYTAILPDGDYTLRFVHKGTGKSYWPQFVEEIWEQEPNCSPYISDANITLIVPDPEESECNTNMVRNPDGELGSFNFWGHSGGGVTIVESLDLDGTVRNGAFAIASDNREGSWHGIGQYLDTRCFSLGRKYEIIVRIRLRRYDGIYIACNINRVEFNAYDVCPRVSFRMRKLTGKTIGDEVETSYAYPMAIAVGPWKEESWNMLHGQFEVTETMANATSIFMFIERGASGIQFVIDDVTIQPSDFDCSMPIYNTEFEIGDTRFWGHIGTTEIGMYSPGYNSFYALRTTKRKEFWGSMAQDLNKDCLHLGQVYSASAMILLLDSNDNVFDCTAGLIWGTDGTDKICPVMMLRLSSGGIHTDVEIGSMPGPLTKGSWNNIYGTFTVTDQVDNAETVTLYFRKVKDTIDIVIDDLSITNTEGRDPDQLINNGDFVSGDARYFNIYLGGSISALGAGYDTTYDEEGNFVQTDYSLAVTARTDFNFGVRYSLDTKLLESRKLYHAKARIMLIKEESWGPDKVMEHYICDAKVIYGDMACPMIYIISQSKGNPPLKRPVAAVKDTWIPNSWNFLTGVFQFIQPELDANSSLNIVITNAPKNVVMIIDNFELDPSDPSTDSPTSGPTVSPTSNPTILPTSKPSIF